MVAPQKHSLALFTPAFMFACVPESKKGGLVYNSGQSAPCSAVHFVLSRDAKGRGQHTVIVEVNLHAVVRLQHHRA